MELGYKNFIIRLNIYNNDPENKDGPADPNAIDRNIHGVNLPGGDYKGKPNELWTHKVNGQERTEQMGESQKGMVYSSALYAGWQSGNNVVKLGGHHPSIQNASQNWTHCDGFLGILNFGRSQYFADYSKLDERPYFYKGFYNPFSLY
jgi:hypothetical protein